METYKQRIVELIRYDMDYIPEDLSEKIIYDINQDVSETKDEFLENFNKKHIGILQLFAQAESVKKMEEMNKTLKTILYIIIATASLSIIGGLCFYFMLNSIGSSQHFQF